MTDEEGILQKYIECNRRYYCPYCGKELKERDELDKYDIVTYRFCDCEDAQKEREIMGEIERLKKQLPKEKYKIAPQVTMINHW